MRLKVKKNIIIFSTILSLVVGVSTLVSGIFLITNKVNNLNSKVSYSANTSLLNNEIGDIVYEMDIGYGRNNALMINSVIRKKIILDTKTNQYLLENDNTFNSDNFIIMWRQKYNNISNKFNYLYEYTENNSSKTKQESINFSKIIQDNEKKIQDNQDKITAIKNDPTWQTNFELVTETNRLENENNQFTLQNKKINLYNSQVLNTQINLFNDVSEINTYYYLSITLIIIGAFGCISFIMLLSYILILRKEFKNLTDDDFNFANLNLARI